MDRVEQVSPPSWTPNGGQIIPPNSGYAGNNPVQVAGQRPGRQTVLIINTGGGSCLVNSVAQPQTTGITIAPGGVFSLDCEGPVFVSSVAGTTVDVVETYFPMESSRSDLPDFSRSLGVPGMR